jgi:hypothetical protein
MGLSARDGLSSASIISYSSSDDVLRFLDRLIVALGSFMAPPGRQTKQGIIETKTDGQ